MEKYMYTFWLQFVTDIFYYLDYQSEIDILSTVYTFDSYSEIGIEETYLVLQIFWNDRQNFCLMYKLYE